MRSTSALPRRARSGASLARTAPARLPAFALVAIAPLFAPVVGPPPLHAADIAVTAGVYTSTDSATCGLVQALTAANSDLPQAGCPAGDGVDRILLPAGEYAFTAIDPMANDATGPSALDVTESVAIEGAGIRSTFLRRTTGDIVRTLRVSAGATLEISGVRFEVGHAGTFHGGTFLVLGTLLARDAAIISGAAARGGGLAVGPGGEATLERFSMMNVNVSQMGGCVYVEAGGTVTLANVSLSTCNGASGSALAVEAGGSALLRNATLSSNYNGTAVAALGTVEIANTVIADNHGATDPTCTGTLTSLGHNYLEPLTSCQLIGDLTGNQHGTEPLVELADFAYFGMPFYLPRKGSPLIDAGSPEAVGTSGTSCLADDVIGRSRPFGARCDIGASEDIGLIFADDLETGSIFRWSNGS